MRKSKSLKLLSLILATTFAINSYAAVVSDNDGSAFITKSEFDSLKNDFQSQLNYYNTSIDNKIDVAIASYLSGIKVSKQYELKLDPNCHYGFPLYYDANNYWDDYTISGGLKLSYPEFHFEKYQQNYIALFEPGVSTYSASWASGTTSTGAVTTTANTWPTDSTVNHSWGAITRTLFKYNYNGKFGLLNMVKKQSSTRKVNGTNYNVYLIENEGIGKLVHSYESDFSMSSTSGTWFGKGGDSPISSGASIFLGIASSQYGVTGSGTSTRYNIKDPSGTFTRTYVTKSVSNGSGPSWVNQADTSGLLAEGVEATCVEIGAVEFTLNSFQTTRTWKGLWGKAPMAEATNYSNPNTRRLVFSRDLFMPANADYDYCLTADLKQGTDTKYTIAGGGVNTIDEIKAYSFRVGTAYAKPRNAMACVPPWKTYTWHSTTKYAPGTSDKFSYLPATLVSYKDKNNKVHYMDEGMYLGKMERDGEVGMKLQFQRTYGSGSRVELHISKKPFSYDCKDSDLLEYYIGTTKGTKQTLNYNQNYQVTIKDIKKNDELYLEWVPSTSADLSALSSFSDFVLTAEN